MEVTQSASTNIRRNQAEYLRDKEDRAWKKPTNKMLVLDVEALEPSAAVLGNETGIHSSSPIVHSSIVLTPST